MPGQASSTFKARLRQAKKSISKNLRRAQEQTRTGRNAGFFKPQKLRASSPVAKQFLTFFP
jgi:hypothetical protein